MEEEKKTSSAEARESLLQLKEAGAEPGRLKEALLLLQKRAREEGRCGSLQTASGHPCRRYPALGTTVCPKHGARAPQTKAKAERLLTIARLPAIEWIMDALDQAGEDTCETCGFPRCGMKERKRLDSLAFKLLDRTGFGPRATLDVLSKTTEGTLELSILNEDELLEMDDLILRKQRFEAKVQARLLRDASRPKELEAAHDSTIIDVETSE